MKIRFAFLLALAAAGASGLATPAQAWDGCGYGYGYGIGLLYQSLENRVPYFAAHPPVYYSYPVPRTYGYSPFAYPPNVLTPEVVGQVEPLEIINPYVPSSTKDESPAQDRTVSTRRQPQPLVIHNPFVTQSRTIARADQ